MCRLLFHSYTVTDFLVFYVELNAYFSNKFAFFVRLKRAGFFENVYSMHDLYNQYDRGVRQLKYTQEESLALL